MRNSGRDRKRRVLRRLDVDLLHAFDKVMEALGAAVEEEQNEEAVRDGSAVRDRTA